MVYIIQVRPEIRDDTIADYDLKGRDWEWVVGQAVDSKATLDALYVKAIRAIKEASKFGHKEQDWYLKAATRFAAEFEEIDGAIIDQLMALMRRRLERNCLLVTTEQDPTPLAEEEAILNHVQYVQIELRV